jgi:hypothetical protein
MVKAFGHAITPLISSNDNGGKMIGICSFDNTHAAPTSRAQTGLLQNFPLVQIKQGVYR